MTVKELIKELIEMPQDAEVKVLWKGILYEEPKLKYGEHQLMFGDDRVRWEGVAIR